jgi:putative ABC transport system permease protein
VLQDVRFALRTLARRPGFTAVAIATLALGIGANTAIFSVVNAVLLRPLAFPEPDRLLMIRGLETAAGEPSNLSPADFMDYERESRTFARLGAHGWVGFFTVAGREVEPERVGGVNVTEGFFPTLGVQPALGRLFTADEDLPGGPAVVILTHGFWQRRYGGDANILGTTILLNARPATVVGVLPESFRHFERYPDREAQLFAPWQFNRAEPNRSGHFIRAVGRLTPEASVESARTELATIAARLERLYPDSNTEQGVVVDPLLDAIVSESRPALLLLAGAVGFVLLVACANLANLLLASGLARQRELAVRASLGAGRGRLVRQLLTESLILGTLGSLAGLLLAYSATRFLTTLSAAGVPRAESIGIDLMVLGFTLMLGLATGAVFGLVPAFHLSRADVHETLKEGGRSQTAGPLRRRARDLLVAAEVALSIVLLVGAGLLIRSFVALRAVDPGFARDEVVTMQVAVPTATYKEGEQIPFYARLIDAVRALPGVREAGATNILPLTENYDSRGIQIEDRPVPIGQAPSIQARSVTSGYFRALGIPLIRGRGFTDRDTAESPLVVIVSDSMARRYWPGENPIGQRITFNSGIPRERQQPVGGPGSREIIGVVGDVKHLGLDDAETPFFYTPHAQQPSYHAMTLVIRTAGDPASLPAAVRRELAPIDPNVPLSQVRTLEAVLAQAVAAPRFRTLLLGLFAGLALILALVGVYGVVGYLVGQRTHEIGVRFALGARASSVVAMLVRQGMTPVVAGMGVGLAGAVAVSRLLGALLFGVASTDIATYAAAAGVLGAAALASTIVPALRVMRIDPVAALRAE